MALSKFALTAIALGIGCGSAAVLAEGFARVAGREPWTPITELNDRPFVAMREADPVLGWRNTPGHYTSPAYVAGGEGSRVWIWDDGSRAAAPAPVSADESVTFFGGSFVFGQGISDEETLVWRLQAIDPARRYANFGVSAYGTYQSLLLLEKRLASGDAPAQIVYGLIDHHRTRNAGRTGWMRHLSRFSRSPVGLPYCSLDDEGALVRHTPESYPKWPLREWLASVNMFGDAVTDIAHDQRFRDRHRITELLLLEMDSLCRLHGARLLVALLGNEEPSPSADARFLDEQGIAFADCRFFHTPELRVEGEGHPNAIANGKWLSCLAPHLGLTRANAAASNGAGPAAE